MRQLLFAGIIFVSACSTAAPPQSAETNNNIKFVNNSVAKTKTASGEDLICKEFEQTGSRLKTITSCHTKAEWDKIESDTQRNIQDLYLKHGSDHG